MFKKFKQPNFHTKLFVAASLATFILFAVFFFVIKINTVNNGSTARQKVNSNNKYYLNENYSEGDPFITKVPNLKDMLAGPIITDLDPIIGDKNASVAIVEFSDFECSFCYKQEQNLKKLMQKYEHKIKLIWKDYPESDKDSVSFQAAIAARCAQAQDKFWPYHDFLYDNNSGLNQETYYRIAGLLNLNTEIFKQCLNSKKPKNLINDNIEEANALDINGIPFIYINDQEVMGEISLEELERIIEIEMNKF